LNCRHVLAQFFKTLPRFVEIEAGARFACWSIGAPTEISKDNVAPGKFDREPFFEIAIHLLALDQGIPQQHDSIAIAQLEGGGDRSEPLSANTEKNNRQAAPGEQRQQFHQQRSITAEFPIELETHSGKQGQFIAEKIETIRRPPVAS